MPILNCENVFYLQLANGQGWHMIATEKVRPLLEKLASIIELKACEPNGFPKLIFIQRLSSTEGWQELICGVKQNILEGFPRAGWKAHNLGALQLWSHRDVPDVIWEIGLQEDHDLDIIRMWLSLHPIYQRAQDLGGLPLHAALVEWNGTGVLLAAPGNTGKSTCCRRLPNSWHALCDDETLIVRDDQKRYFAHPFPTWSDYLCRRSERTWNVQKYVPLSAIFFLEQSEIDEATRIGQAQAAMFIIQLAEDVCQRSWRGLEQEEERALKKRLFDNACEFAKTVPVFKLRFSLSGRFWQKIEEALE